VPKTQGVIGALKEYRLAISLLRHGKAPLPIPPHVAKDVDEARALHDLVQAQGRDGAAGIVQGERALARIEPTEHGAVQRDAPAVTPGEEPPAGEG
jgi:hypothetical protein